MAEIKSLTLKETDKYLVSLSSKTYVFGDKLTKYLSVWLFIFFLFRGLLMHLHTNKCKNKHSQKKKKKAQCKHGQNR